MAKIVWEGLDDFTKGLDLSASEIEKISSIAVYDAAGIIQDSIKNEIPSINPNCFLNERERDDLLANGHFGISSIQHKNGETFNYVDAGKYNDWVWHSNVSNKYDNGQPIPLIINSIVSGSSMRKGRDNFVDRGFRKVKEEAVNKMIETIEDEVEKLFK